MYPYIAGHFHFSAKIVREPAPRRFRQKPRKYRKATLRAMSKAASANKAYRSPDSYRIYHHTIPAGKTVDGMAVDLYFDLPSAVGLINSLSSHK